eukprot:2632880-Prymnesium_polylepis.1
MHTGSGSGSGGTRPSARHTAGACGATLWYCSWPGRDSTNRRASGSSPALKRTAWAAVACTTAGWSSTASISRMARVR